MNIPTSLGPARRRAAAHPLRQRGVTMLVVLVLLSVMLLGGLAFARLTEVSTLASGNTAFREASLQASEIGLNTVYARIRNDIADEETAIAPWYWHTTQATDGNGIPNVDFDNAPEIVVGNYRVAYVAERMCEGTMPVTEPLRQCLVKQVPQDTKSRTAGREELDPPNSRQYRVTIRVIGPKDTRAWVQSLITKG
jgi:type IV pilus assembly protein PilX